MAANCIRKKLEYHNNCTINPKCCLKPNQLECPTNFNPPVLGTSDDFCKEALAKAIPIKECILAKPEKLMIATEPIQEVVLPTHRHLKNWQKWCRVWKENQEQLAVARKDPNPPLMTCGEGWSYRKEDTELFDRTLYPNSLRGCNIKNTLYPDGLHPGEKDPIIREVVLPRHSRKFNEMKRYRYAQRIRDEMGLPVRCAEEFIPIQSECQQNTDDQKQQGEGDILVDFETSATKGRCFNWEDRWRHYVASSNWMLTADLLKYGYPRPTPENLILQQPKTSIPDKFVNADAKGHRNIDVPELTFSLQVNENVEERTSSTPQDDKRYYNEAHGPVLQVMGQKADIELSYKGSIADPSNRNYFFEEWEPFSATTKGKETRFIGLKNEGTTAIRYQWLRFPASKEMGNMLSNPARYLALGGDCQDNMRKAVDHFTLDINTAQTESTKTVPKPASLEFRFRELPGVLLPGQSVELPIVFRCENTGYYYETLYLLTHPNLSDELGRSYAIRLTGNCADPDLDTNTNGFRPGNVTEALKQITLEQEATDLINSVLDHALFHENNFPCSLPFGKVTTEGIFYTHNKHLNYHYGTSEKSLEIVRNLIEMLIPQERLNFNENLCTLSIQSLYRHLWNRNTPRDYYWTHFKSPHAEKLLKNLAEQNNILIKPRIFTYPNVETRKKTSCYTTLLSVFDEILTAMDSIDELYSSPELDKIYEENAQVNIESGRLSSLNENYINLMDLEAEYADENGTLSDEEETQITPSPDEATENDTGADGDLESNTISEEETKRRSNKSARSEPQSKKKSVLEKEPSTPEPKAKSKQKDKEIRSKSKSNDEKDAKLDTGTSKKEKNRKLKESSQGKVEKVEILTVSSPEEEEAQPADEEGEESNNSAHTQPSEYESDVGTPPVPGTPPGTKPLSDSGQGVKDEINGERKLRADQLKRIMFESIFSAGIERMISVVDAMKSIEDYRTSPYVTKPDDNFCCSE